MKVKIFSFLTVILLVLFSCESLNEPDNNLTGSWEWVESQGGIAGITLTPQTEGYTKVLIFREQKQYFELRNDTLFFSEGYNVTTKKSYLFNELKPILEIDNQNVEQIINFKDEDTLYLVDDIVDGFFHKYKRTNIDVLTN